MHEALRHRLLGGWADRITAHPVLTLLIAAAAAVASIVLTLTRLEFNANRNDLIDPDIAWNQRFIEWQSSFPGSFDLYIVVDTFGKAGVPSAEARQTARAIVDALGPRLASDPHVREVVWGFDPRQVSPKAMRLLPMAEFTRRVEQFEAVAELLGSASAWSVLGRFIGGADAIEAEAEGEGASALATLRELAAQRWQYLESDNGRLLFIRITPRREADAIDAFENAIASIRATLADVLAEHPSADAGLTGIEVVESDETQAATRDSTIASIIAVVLISAVLIAAFHSYRMPLIIVTTLLVAMAWSFGFVTLAIGHLQIISVVFTVMLLGLGVAFGIHLASRFELVRHDHVGGREGFDDAMRDTIETMGPGLITGALTTAAAFSTTLLTDFTGVAEMGLIAAVGILLCLLAMFSVFPAMLKLIKPGRRHVRRMEHRYFHLYEDRWIMPFVRRPWATVAVWVALAGASIYVSMRMHFDYNLTNMLPAGIDSVQWQERIMADGGQSIYFGVSIVADHESARQRAEAFRERAAQPGSTIRDVGGYAWLFPPNEANKIALLEAARQRIGPTLQRVLDEVEADADRPRLPVLGAVRRQVDQLRAKIARGILMALDTTPLREEDLPAPIIRSYTAGEPGSPQRRLAIEVYPRLPEGVDSPLDPRFLGRFIAEMQRVDPQITGVIGQIYFSGDLIRRSYTIAGVLALAVVFCIVVADFRSVVDGLMSLLPVAMGFGITFGVLWLSGEQLNVANIIVLPLMFGIGVDFGVHVLHRYRVDPLNRPLGLTAGTGKGIVLTAITTVIGFAAMLIARHRGVASLGYVLSIGISLTLIACLTLMPAILELRSRRGRKSS